MDAYFLYGSDIDIILVALIALLTCGAYSIIKTARYTQALRGLQPDSSKVMKRRTTIDLI